MSMLLIDLPNVAMSVILDKIDLKSIQVLRKVCHYFRDRIDSTQLDFTLKRISVDASPEKLLVTFGWGSSETLNVTYKQVDTGCFVEHKGRQKLLENQDSISIAANDLGMIITHQKSMCDSLVLTLNVDETHCDNFLESFRHHLNLRCRDLQTKLFFVKGLTKPSQLISLISHLELEKANITFEIDPTPRTLHALTELRQWKAMKEFGLYGFMISDLSVNKFNHLPRSRCNIDTISAEDLIAFKEFLLKRSPTFRSAMFHYQTISNRKHLLDTFGKPAGLQRLAQPRIWFFIMADSDDVIRFNWMTYRKIAWITRIQKADIPEFAFE